MLTSQEVNNYLEVKGLTFNKWNFSFYTGPGTQYVVQLNGNSGGLQWEILFSNLSYMTVYTNIFVTVFIIQFGTLKFTNSPLSPTDPYSLHNLMLLPDTDAIVIKQPTNKKDQANFGPD